jgi:putative ABC transport system substrate-binding protein
MACSGPDGTCRPRRGRLSGGEEAGLLDIRRREFISLLGGAAAAWPLAVRAQRPAMPVIGYLSSTSSGPYAPFVAAFQEGLKETGFVAGQNVTIEYRWAEGQFDRLPELAAELVRRQVVIIAVGGGGVTALAAKDATPTIPIVFAFGSDPVKLGLVASLNRPGGNITGVSYLAVELGPKRLELLREILPKAAAIGFLMNPGSPNTTFDLPDMEAAARTLGQQLIIANASNDLEIGIAFEALMQQRADALVIQADPFLFSRRTHLAALALRDKIPTIYIERDFAADGGLLSYGTDFVDANRQAGIYAGRILKGEKPADLPVLQPTRFQLVINLKTAKALGLTIPPGVLARADEVIE